MDLKSKLFNIKLNNGEPHVGSLLVAEPFLREESFNHAVILLLDYDKTETAMGLVVNKSTGYTLGQLIDDSDCNVPVYRGGPVGDDRLFYIHTLGDLIKDSSEIADGLWLGGDFDTIKEYLKDGYPTDGLLRFILGYSGWQAGQLEEELENGVWAVANEYDSKSLLIDSNDATWHRTVRGMGERFRGWLYHPMDPNSN